MDPCGSCRVLLPAWRDARVRRFGAQGLEQARLMEDARFFGETFNKFPNRERTLPRVLLEAASRHGERDLADLPRAPMPSSRHARMRS